MRDDDDGQIDGDGDPSPYVAPGLTGSPFAANFGAQPWMRGGLPPWHLWGNVIPIGPISGFASNPVQFTGQLVRAAYKRPETWHWIFGARIVNAPVAGGAGSWQLSVAFDLIVGIGRSMLQLPSFETLRWTWTGSFVPTQPLWSTNALATTDYTLTDGVPSLGTQRIIDQIVAQDIQLNCRASLIAIDEPGGGQANVEVSAYFAPKHHARPDWYQIVRTVREAQFAGDETGGT